MRLVVRKQPISQTQATITWVRRRHTRSHIMPILSISTFAFTYTFKFFGFFWVFICALSYTFNVGYLFIYYGFWVFFFLVSCLERNLYKKYFLEGFVVFFAWINLDIVFQQYSIFQE